MIHCIPLTLIVACRLLLSSLCHASSEEEEGTLILSQLLWRHGDRSPTTLFPTYPGPVDAIWPMGLGALTPRGMEQHLLLGRELRKKFKGFINKTYHSSEIRVTSTDFDRTLMSAQMNMAGLYGQLTVREIRDVNETFSQPVPVHADFSGILSPGAECPAFAREKAMVEKRSSDARRNREENGTLVDSIKFQSGNVSLKILNIADAVYCSDQHGVELPTWIANNQTIKNYLDFYYSELGPRLFMGSDKLARLGGGPLLSALVAKMKEKIAGNLTQKVLAYSAHDVTIMALLGALRVFDNKQPTYASLISVDLFRSPSSGPDEGSGTSADPYFVVVKYLRGVMRPDIGKAKILVIPGCAKHCPLTKFVRSLAENIAEGSADKCGRSGTESGADALARDSVILSLSMVIALLVATLFFSCVFFLVRQRRMRNLLPMARFSLIDDEASVPLTSHDDEGETYGFTLR